MGMAEATSADAEQESECGLFEGRCSPTRASTTPYRRRRSQIGVNSGRIAKLRGGIVSPASLPGGLNTAAPFSGLRRKIRIGMTEVTSRNDGQESERGLFEFRCSPTLQAPPRIAGGGYNLEYPLKSCR